MKRAQKLSLLFSTNDVAIQRAQAFEAGKLEGRAAAMKEIGVQRAVAHTRLFETASRMIEAQAHLMEYVTMAGRHR